MKAVITTGYGSPDVFKIEEVKKPQPKPNEILVQINAASITKADTMMRTGKPYLGRLFLGLFKPKHRVWGTGFAGVVTAIGSEVSRFKKGDKVFGESTQNFGTYAQYVALPAEGIVAHLPPSMSFDEAAGLCDGGLASLNFLSNLGQIKAGQKVLINGASGSLGCAAVQIAKHLGTDVTGVCSEPNMALVTSLGANQVIDYNQSDFTQNNEKYHFIYDTVGTHSYYQCRNVLTTKGIYASPVLSKALLCDTLFANLFNQQKTKFSATGALPLKESKRLLNMLIAILNTGHFKSVVDKAYPLENIIDAHRYIDTGRKKGNVVLKP